VFSAKEKVVELLRASGDLDGEQKGDKPLEVVTSRQWYIRNGGRDAERRERMLARGAELNWHPAFMKARYDDWVGGLNGDWLISRQRFFGVPIPVWYPLDAQGEPVYDSPIVPAAEQLPVDPAAEPAPGYDESQRDQPGGFAGDPDVLDTWATSSLSPQIVTGWGHDADLHAKTYPMDLRPQAHEIIRTWLFSSVVRADALTDSLPWTDATISGWVLDPDRKKMSKSKGNVVVPTDTLEKFGSDAVRYWAASARLGADTAFDEGQIKIGRRLAIKLLNASKFVLAQGVTESSVLRAGSPAGVVTDGLDRALLAQLAAVVERATQAFQDYEYARALQLTESFFWTFTDDYVELVKDRAYGARGEAAQASVHAALATTLDALLRLFAPFLPFATDEVWSWWRAGSVHRAVWPTTEGFAALVADADPEVLTTVGEALSGLRKAKSEAKVKQRTEVRTATITGSPAEVARLEAGLGDLKAAGNAGELRLVAGEAGLSVRDVELAPAEEPAR
jgi:valyl-tRNA synthetase